MLKGLMLVCGDDFHSNKPLRQVRKMLLGRRGCRRISDIKILNPRLGTLHLRYNSK